ncbi:MAG: signal peptidase I [Hyphomicrobiales bacterium]
MEDGDNREPDDGFDAESDSGWYFDLPSGAWERQEAKNRELRQSVRQNVEDKSQPAQRDDPFGPRSRGLFGFGRKSEEAPDSGRAIAGGKWVLNPEATSGGEAPQSRASSDDDPFAAFRAGQPGQDQPGDDDDDEWSTEAILPPVRELRVLSRDDEEEPQPETRGFDDAPRRVGWADAFPSGADDAGDSSLSAMAAWAKRETPPQEPSEPAPGGEKAGEDSLTAMAAWAKRYNQPETPSGEPGDDAAAQAPPVQPAAILPLRRRSAEDEPEPEAPAEGEGSSRWNEMFSGAPGESNILEAMRSWSSGEMKLGIDEPEPEEPREIPPEFLKPFDWEDSAEPPQSVASETESEPAGELVSPVAEAVEAPHAEEPEAAAVPSEPEPAATEAVAAEVVLSDWADDESPKEEVASWAELDQAFEAPKSEKKGFLSRLFGRKKKDAEPQAETAALETTGAWVPEADDTDDIRVVARGAFGDFESEPAPWGFSGQAASEAAANAATFGAWLPATDDTPATPDTSHDASEPAATVAEDTQASAEVQQSEPDEAPLSEWAPEYEAPEAHPEPVAEIEQDRPYDSAEPAAVVEADAVAPGESDAPGWDPEPFEEAVPTGAAASAAESDAIDAAEAAPTWGQADDEPVDEPWAVVDDARETPGDSPEVSFEAPSADTLTEAAEEPVAVIEDESEDDAFAAALNAFDADSTVAKEPVAVIEDESEDDAFAAALNVFGADSEVAEEPVAVIEDESEDAFAAALDAFDAESEIAEEPVASIEDEPEDDAFAAALSAFDAESELADEPAANIDDESEDDAFAAALNAFDAESDDAPPAAARDDRPPLYVVPPPPEAEDNKEVLPDNVVEMPRKDEDDDPWAAFIASRRASGDPFPKGEVPADSNPAGWDEVFSGTGAATSMTANDDAVPEVPPTAEPVRSASIEQPPLFSWDNPPDDGEREELTSPEASEPAGPSFDEEDAASDSPAQHDAGDGQEPASDDPWAAVAEASGYGGAPTEVAVYRGHGERPSPTPPEEPAYEPPPRRDPLPRPEPVFRSDWAAEPDEEDVVLKAFYEHANTELPDGEDDDDLHGGDGAKGHVLEGILGKEAAELVGESSDPYEQAIPPAHGWTPPAPFSQPEEPVGWQPFDAAGSGPSWNQPPGGGEPPQGPDTTFDGDRFEPEPAAAGGSRVRTAVREVVETLLLAALVFLCVRASFQNFKVDGTSMEPTLDDGQFLIVNKLVYSEVDTGKLSKFLPFIDPGDQPKKHIFHGPQRGDIIVLQDPSDLGTDLIKRVIGLPGDRIAIVNGQVYINGFRLEEPYIKKPWHYNMEEIRIPEDHYFVMGDNRDNSKDSRFSSIGTVQEDLIIGKAMFAYWPWEKFGLAPNASPDLTDEKPHLTTERITATP